MIGFTFLFFNIFAFGEFEEKYFAFLEGLPERKRKITMIHFVLFWPKY